ncbi:DUF4157 domain-containing protein [Anabaena catenula FACHB-362]|uniref:DUF4157 domain-containing protein n=2 Tax=Anabaena TaxID=1163 RepID=A0ABR8J3M2_9NOST|nr:DUF4157 domain-containing protein [Anabaena catenula FACHB-362]
MSQMTAMQTKAAEPATQAIQRQEEHEEAGQMKSEQSSQPSIQRQAASPTPSSGNSIPGGVRAKMENSFGTSFSDVNIHTDSIQAKSIGALAYTQGSNIHFAPGQYNPQSPSGQSLLGHELTHVVQQRAGRVAVPTQSKGAPINADPSLENEADQMGAKAARGEVAQVPGAAGGMASSSSPIQNSTQPVQCFLPLLLGGLLGGIGGGMGDSLFRTITGGGGGGAGGGGGGMMPPPMPMMPPPMPMMPPPMSMMPPRMPMMPPPMSMMPPRMPMMPPMMECY